MNAVVFDRCGPPADVCAVKEVPRPEPRRGEVLVRMIASPVNPSDLMYIQGVYGLKPKLPATPGFEGVGVVEASGGGIVGMLRKGKRVAVLNDDRGNWGEYTVAAEKKVIPVPDDIPDEQSASFFVNPATVLVMTEKVLKIPAGATLLQTAAGSALGSMIIRMGKLKGFKTINVVRRGEQVEELKKLGADHVVVAEGDGLESKVKAILPAGVPFAIDPVGGVTGGAAARCLAAGGHMLCYGNLSGESIPVDPRFLLTGSKRIQGFWLADHMNSLSILQKLKLIRAVKTLFRAGVVTTPSVKTFALNDVKAALEFAGTPGRNAKVLLKIGA
jgi:NADPH:quinone reductase-like Zn-dependent oxidoreductase